MKTPLPTLLSSFLVLAAIFFTFPLSASCEEGLFDQTSPDSVLHWEWDTFDKEWELHAKYTYTYNADNQIITTTSYFWSDNTWSPRTMRFNTYDNTGNLVEEKFERHTGSSWEHSSIYTYVYNDIGDLISYNRVVWEDTAYVNNVRHNYQYSSDHRIVVDIRQSWNTSQGWRDITKETSTYDDQKNLVHWLQEGWVGDDWHLSIQSFYSYTPFNLQDTILDQMRFPEFWRNDARTINLYDVNQNLIETTQENFVNGGFEFTKRERFTYTVDNDLLFKTTELFNGIWFYHKLYKYESDELHRIISEVERNLGGDLMNVDSFRYYFTTSTSVQHQNAASDFLLFPNPAGEHLDFKWPGYGFEEIAIEIYTASGVKVYEAVIPYEKQIDISKFSPGTYFVNCRVGGARFTKAFVKI